MIPETCQLFSVYLLNMATDKKVEIVEFGKKIQHYRKALGWSQEELAAMAGIEPKQVSKVERGASDIRLSTAIKLISALNIEPNDVIPFTIRPQAENKSDI